MRTKFFWREYPRIKPDHPGIYLVTYDMKFTDEREVDVDTWDGSGFGYKDGVIAWMPCPNAYNSACSPTGLIEFTDLDLEKIEQMIEMILAAKLDPIIDIDRFGTKINQTEK